VENEFGAPLESQADGQAGTIKGHSGTGPKISLSTDRGKLSIRKN